MKSEINAERVAIGVGSCEVDSLLLAPYNCIASHMPKQTSTANSRKVKANQTKPAKRFLAIVSN